MDSLKIHNNMGFDSTYFALAYKTLNPNSELVHIKRKSSKLFNIVHTGIRYNNLYIDIRGVMDEATFLSHFSQDSVEISIAYPEELVRYASNSRVGELMNHIMHNKEKYRINMMENQDVQDTMPISIEKNTPIPKPIHNNAADGVFLFNTFEVGDCILVPFNAERERGLTVLRNYVYHPSVRTNITQAAE